MVWPHSIDYDHADWAGARLVAASAAPAAKIAAQIIPPSTISPVPIINVTAATVASAWSNTLVGNVGQIGGASESGSSFTVAGVGGGIAGTADAVDYAYQSLVGDGTIVARLNTTETGTGEAGVMIRESLGAGAREVALVIGPKSVKFAQRTKLGGTAKSVITKIKAVMPQWMKLVRKGKTFTAYDSIDGAHWTKVGSTTLNLNATANIGLISDSGSTTKLNPVVFSNVMVTSAAPTRNAAAKK